MDDWYCSGNIIERGSGGGCRREALIWFPSLEIYFVNSSSASLGSGYYRLGIHRPGQQTCRALAGTGGYREPMVPPPATFPGKVGKAKSNDQQFFIMTAAEARPEEPVSSLALFLAEKKLKRAALRGRASRQARRST
ncbi:hypothetical protein E2C01_090530 [Portunus trituberculatus]|uniref:Uncharacterized protein n=1 Tax=Portunus trituberculatus TaxID=210409 RepID=A0A5B7JLM1_PORTR|nr:hypothetical protein [Portunus trituberculatus]